MKNIVLTILVLFFGNCVFAQVFVDVKDPVLAKILCDSFPGAMANNCTQLDLSKEALIPNTLNLSGRGIHDISPLLELTETVQLWVEKSGLDTIKGDFSKLVNLEVLVLSWNEGFSVFPDFSTINSPKFRILSIEHMRLKDGLDLSSVKNSLEELNALDNYIDKLPDFSTFPNLKKVDLRGNRLTFYDLKPLLSSTSVNYQLFKQKIFNTFPANFGDALEGNAFELTIDADTLDKNNVYYWYKDNALFNTSSNPILRFDEVTLQDSGSYHLIVRNPIFPNNSDTLFTKPYRLKITPKPEECKILEKASIKTVTACNVHQIELNVDVNPIQYEIKETNSSSWIMGKNKVFENINDGIYTLKISTPKCVITYPDKINISSKTDCDNIISPNGDGIGDRFYLKQTGLIKVINKNGKTLAHLKGPLFWDGTNDNGGLIDGGYYIILFENGEVSDITIER